MRHPKVANLGKSPIPFYLANRTGEPINIKNIPSRSSAGSQSRMVMIMEGEALVSTNFFQLYPLLIDKQKNINIAYGEFGNGGGKSAVLPQALEPFVDGIYAKSLGIGVFFSKDKENSVKYIDKNSEKNKELYTVTGRDTYIHANELAIPRIKDTLEPFLELLNKNITAKELESWRKEVNKQRELLGVPKNVPPITVPGGWKTKPSLDAFRPLEVVKPQQSMKDLPGLDKFLSFS